MSAAERPVRALIGTLVLGAVLAAGVARADGVDDFWEWFEYEHEALIAPATRVDRHEALVYWLGRIDPALSYELEDGGRRKTLTISADGDVNLFRTVELMIDRGPKVKGWKLVALRQKQRTLESVTVEPVTLDPATTFFDLYEDSAKIGVVFYLPVFDADNMAAYRIAAMRLMSQSVGEWEVGLDIGFVDFDNQQVRDMQFSRPFKDFKTVFAKLRK